MDDGGLPPQSHSDDLTLLETALDAVSATNLDTLPVTGLLDRACRLQTLSARIDAARATVLAAADTASEASGVLRELGFRTASQVVAAETGAPAREIHTTARTNTDGSIDGRFYLDTLSAEAVGTALGDEMQRLFRHQSQHNGTADTPNRRRGQALVGLVVGGAEAPGSAYGLASQVQLEFAYGKLAPSTSDAATFAEGKLGFAGRSTAKRRSSAIRTTNGKRISSPDGDQEHCAVQNLNLDN